MVTESTNECTAEALCKRAHDSAEAQHKPARGADEEGAAVQMGGVCGDRRVVQHQLCVDDGRRATVRSNIAAEVAAEHLDLGARRNQGSASSRQRAKTVGEGDHLQAQPRAALDLQDAGALSGVQQGAAPLTPDRHIATFADGKWCAVEKPGASGRQKQIDRGGRSGKGGSQL
eukprot:7385315-Prymnesium_polylepis.2